MSRLRTPAEKKRRSYESDCRNVVAESGSSARKAIAKRKAGASQALRKAVRDKLVKLGPAASVDEFDVSVERTGRKSFSKYPDLPLAQAIQRKLDNPRRFKSTIAAPSETLMRAQVSLSKKRGR